MSTFVLDETWFLILLLVSVSALTLGVLDFIITQDNFSMLNDKINHVVNSSNTAFNMVFKDVHTLCGTLPHCIYNGEKP